MEQAESYVKACHLLPRCQDSTQKGFAFREVGRLLERCDEMEHGVSRDERTDSIQAGAADSESGMKGRSVNAR